MLETLLVLPTLFAVTAEAQPQPATMLLPPPMAAEFDAAPVGGDIAAASSTSASPEPVSLPEVRFPEASGPLHLDVDGEGFSITYEMLVRRYGEMTGATMIYSDETSTLLANSRVRLDAALDVPAGEAVTAMETLLAQRGFVLGLSQAGSTTIVMVTSIHGSDRGQARSNAVAIDASKIAVAAQHPAMMVMVSLELPNTDVRQVSNSMRTLITDANTQQMLPAGNSNTMVLVGTGANVAAMAQTLRMIDDASAQIGALPSVAVEVVALQHANAPALAGVLNEILAPRPMGPTQGVHVPTFDVRVVSDERTNSVLVRGLPADVEMVKRIVKELDRAVD